MNVVLSGIECCSIWNSILLVFIHVYCWSLEKKTHRIFACLKIHIYILILFFWYIQGSKFLVKKCTFSLLGDVESFADCVLLFIMETYFYTLSNYYNIIIIITIDCFWSGELLLLCWYMILCLLEMEASLCFLWYLD